MKIVIKDVENNRGHYIVVAETQIGVIKGIWKGKNKPDIGDTYFAELDMDDIECSNIEIVTVPDIMPSVYCEGDTCYFCGICENADEIYIVRFDVDWIEMVGITNDDKRIHEGDKIFFSQSFNLIDIYPYKL